MMKFVVSVVLSILVFSTGAMATEDAWDPDPVIPEALSFTAYHGYDYSATAGCQSCGGSMVAQPVGCGSSCGHYAARAASAPATCGYERDCAKYADNSGWDSIYEDY